MTWILTDFLSLFFPNICTICKTPLISGEERICLSCLNKLPYTRFSADNNPLTSLFAGRTEINNSHAFLYYAKGGLAQKLVFSLKYYNNKELGLILGRMAALSLSRLPDYELPDILLPVPLHKKRLRDRGYNQSEWIAKGFSSVWERPIDTTSLVRIKKTETQTRKSLYERIMGMETTFRLTNQTVLEGKHILLIDDVITSGATINACIKELQLCKEVRFSVFCLSVAQ